jgi:predicted amidohydrolase YtcJ
MNEASSQLRKATALATSHAAVVDFGDGVVVPGFADAHAHLAVAAEEMLRLDLSIGGVRAR